MSQLGFWLLVTARVVLVFEITGSAQAVGAIYFFTFIPQLLLGPHSGVLADRFDRRQILIASQLVQVGGTAAMGFLAATDTATLFNLSVLSAVVGSMHVVSLPASNALMPALVGRDALSSAVTLTSAVQQVSRVIGPLGAAALIAAFGVSTLFYGNAIAGLIVVIAWWLTPVSADFQTDMNQRSRYLRRGFAAVRRAGDMWSPIVIIAVLNAVGLIYQPLGVAYATDILAGGDTDRGTFVFGVFQAVLGAGAAQRSPPGCLKSRVDSRHFVNYGRARLPPMDREDQTCHLASSTSRCSMPTTTSTKRPTPSQSTSTPHMTALSNMCR